MATRKNSQSETELVDACILRAATMAAAGMQGRQIARELGVSEATVSRWRSRADYQAIYNSVLREATDTAMARLRHMTRTAIHVLEETLNDDKASRGDRLRAAQIVLAHVIGDSAHESRIGPTDAGVIESRIKAQEKSRELEAALDDLVGAWGA